MHAWSIILPNEAAIDSAALDASLATIPAKWCVALLIDAGGRPLQLLCTKNLRATLRRRFEEPVAENGEAVASKRIDYRSLVHRIAWQRVDGDLQMDLAYIEAARVAFPVHWRRLIPDREAHFVCIDPKDKHPDFVRESSVSAKGHTWGPFPDRSKADRWIDAARDAFDLCRYRNILAQSPNGRACAYKQMGKCPAPCDGTIALENYRVGVEGAVHAINSPEQAEADLLAQMKMHAANLEFEQAGRLKTRLAALQQLRAGPYASIRSIEQFRFLSIQPGPKKGTARLFVLDAHGVEEVAGVLGAEVFGAEIIAIAHAATIAKSPWPSEVLLGVLSYHLAGAKTSSRFVSMTQIGDALLQAMLKSAMKAPAATAEVVEAVRETRLEI